MTLTWSLTTALFIPGGMIGAFLGGWLADKIGRFVRRLFFTVSKKTLVIVIKGVQNIYVNVVSNITSYCCSSIGLCG